jgi:hypothetical protein
MRLIIFSKSEFNIGLKLWEKLFWCDLTSNDFLNKREYLTFKLDLKS